MGAFKRDAGAFMPEAGEAKVYFVSKAVFRQQVLWPTFKLNEDLGYKVFWQA